jgi:hypothetical protein
VPREIASLRPFWRDVAGEGKEGQSSARASIHSAGPANCGSPSTRIETAPSGSSSLFQACSTVGRVQTQSEPGPDWLDYVNRWLGWQSRWQLQFSLLLVITQRARMRGTLDAHQRRARVEIANLWVGGPHQVGMLEH